MTVTAAGAVPLESVFLVASAAGSGAGPCPIALGGLCLDLLPPTKPIGAAVADADGVATWTFTLPVALGLGVPVGFQAAAARRVGGVEWVAGDVLLARTAAGPRLAPNAAVGTW